MGGEHVGGSVHQGEQRPLGEASPSALHTCCHTCQGRPGRVSPQAGRGRGWKLSLRAEGGARSTQAPPPEPRRGGNCVSTRRRQGDDDVTQAAGFGMFGRRRPLPGNARQARRQGPAPRGSLRTPVRSVLARLAPSLPLRFQEDAGFRSSPTSRLRPGRPAGRRLLPSRFSLSLPVSPLSSSYLILPPFR